MTEARTQRKDGWTAVIQFLVLLGLCLIVFRHEYVWIVAPALTNPEAAHIWVAPILILILFARRAKAMEQALSRGSVWGLVLLLGALFVHAASTWPFNYGYPRYASFVIAVAGAVLAVGGWRVLRLSLPMLLMLMIALPIGTRLLAFAIIKPETLTFQATRSTLDLLPGIFVDLTGPDLSYMSDSSSGWIALGEPNRGASLLFASLMIVVFATFVRIRPFWQVIVMAFAAVPIVMICNYLRLVVFGLVTIYGACPPLSPVPRLVSAIVSLVLAYLLTIAMLAVISNVFVDPREQDRKRIDALPT